MQIQKDVYMKNNKKWKPIEEYCLLDDILMKMAFQDDIVCTECLLQVILNNDKLKVIKVSTQKELYSQIGGRSVRLDIEAIDENGHHMNVEVQRDNDGASPRRARYHSSMIDVKMLNSGQDFSELKDNYVIFITQNDVMNLGDPVYDIRRYIKNNMSVFDDGSHILYVNSSYKNTETKLGQLIHDLVCLNPDEMYYKPFAEKVYKLKRTEGGRKIMGSEIEKIYKAGQEEGQEVGKEIGARQKAIQIAKNLLKLKLPLKDIAESSELTLEEVEKLAAGQTI